MEQALGLASLALRFWPWFGMAIGLTLLIREQSIKDLRDDRSRRWVKAVGVAICGMSIGTLAAIF